MSYSIFYKGTLKQMDATDKFLNVLTTNAMRYEWLVRNAADGGIAVDIPDCEPLVFRFNDGRVNAWVKYFAHDTSATAEIDKIFNLLWSVKPLFKRLEVHDEDGLWNDFSARQSTEKKIPLRELKGIEKAEIERCFDLPKGQTALYPMTDAQAVLMWMVCKDLNPHLEKPLELQDVINLVDSRIVLVGPPDEPIEEQWDSTQFIAIIESWMLKKLTDKKGASLDFKENTANNFMYFSWLMAEIIFGFGGGNLGSKHSKLHRFVDSLLAQGYDLDDASTFLRLIYSALEYLGIYRPDTLIERS